MLATDRRYTGQQQESGDPALGLYNYKARCYSTVLGRFVSADTVADGLNRYSYVHDNPLRFVDPTGLDAAIFCGTGDTCQSGNIGSFKAWVIGYWQNHEHIFGGIEDYAFAMLEIVLGRGWEGQQTLSAFHVGFIDTINNPGQFADLAAKENAPIPFRHYDALEHWENLFWSLRATAPRYLDTIMGYSAGGAVAARVLEHAASHGYTPETAILIQPSLTLYGVTAAAFGTSLNASDLPQTRIITINDTGSAVSGRVPGAIDVTTVGACSGFFEHCTEQSEAQFVTWAAQLPYDITRALLNTTVSAADE